MASACLEKTQIVQTLQVLMDRLTSPDLTVAEANDIRPRLACLLDAIENGHPPDRSERRC